MSRDRELVTALVLRAVELVPPGRVASYGTIADVVGCGPRQVGAVLADVGGTVAWWRVTNAAGELPPTLLQRALPIWRAEGIELTPNGRGCRYRAYAMTAQDWDAWWSAVP